MKISGHSLGAGVASIAGAWAALQWPAADIQVVTFGSPMPGNAMFAEVREFEPACAAATYVTQSVCPAGAAPCAAACNVHRDPGWRHPQAVSHGFCYISAILTHKGLSMQLYKLLVGRQNRVVHSLDIVPALPPLVNYAPVDYGVPFQLSSLGRAAAGCRRLSEFAPGSSPLGGSMSVRTALLLFLRRLHVHRAPARPGSDGCAKPDDC